MTIPSLTQKKRRVHSIIRVLRRRFPDAACVLRYGSPWELLVAVQLSAQCTDMQVNKVTERLFKKYRTLHDYLVVDPVIFEQDIFATGFYRNKTKNVLAAAKMMHERFGGIVPHTMEEMLTLPGVGRKTANVVLGNAYGLVDGIAVDTHVRRLSRRLGLTRQTDPKKIERDLMEIVPKKDWFAFTYLLIEYGRAYCVARRHEHGRCLLKRYG